MYLKNDPQNHWVFRIKNVPKIVFQHPANRDLLLLDVSEAKDYRLVYDLNLAKLSKTITYDIDDHDKIRQPFDA